MTERAYSYELSRELSAVEAHHFSMTGKLQKKDAFECNDCRIPLSCTKWGEDGQRYYFYPSTKVEHHMEGCTYASDRDITDKIKKEIEEAITIITQTGIIVVAKSKKYAKTNKENSEESESKEKRTYQTSNSGFKNQAQNKKLTALATFVELYNNQEINNEKKNIKVEGETISLDDYFVDVTDGHLIENQNRIFFGEAELSAFMSQKGKSEILAINFVDSDYPPIYSNLEQVKKRSNTRNIAHLIGKESVLIYFRGSLVEKDGKKKFEPFNDAFYKDLYSPEN
ncbi:hypothetical protein [Streptococcus saliviloxodontae]|uniref:Competence protein n=1 Tax=Streptococcus saliviloxodontae TaxID=1349416 RepID=A0ABS2PK46_9STRE|nr:hypothetical protein [Streptococcus saliviloxodontae]MBM7635726.1 hypothetical protein [Streptococcus saliviloxodontae]